MSVFDVAGTGDIASVGGHLHAFDTYHRAPLAKGKLNGTTVTVLYAAVDVTSGAVLRGPAQRPVRSAGGSRGRIRCRTVMSSDHGMEPVSEGM